MPSQQTHTMLVVISNAETKHISHYAATNQYEAQHIKLYACLITTLLIKTATTQTKALLLQRPFTFIDFFEAVPGNY